MHPSLRTAINAPTIGQLVAIALSARVAQDEGRYCECAEPETVGLDLMCGACMLNNRTQEKRRVRQIVEAHNFVPGPLEGLLCKVCTNSATTPRHNGINEVGRLATGEDFPPPYKGT